MDELIAFVTARLDEDEATAKAAQPGPWTLDEWTGGFGRMACVMVPFGAAAANAKTGLTAMAKLGTQDYETAAHIARHDPARVLREVAAKRAILGDCIELAGMDPYDVGDAGVRLAQAALRQMGTAWSDHPDYRQEWAP
jgi:Family of unknown function (DUF6221)